MSFSVNQIITDAKRLVNRLREHDVTAENIITQTQTLYKNVEAMKECSEDFADKQLMNQPKLPRPMFVFNVQQENKHILDLQKENRELRIMLEEHQSVIELIMSKYRNQISSLLKPNQNELGEDSPADLLKLQEKADQICKMAEVMKQSIEKDEKNYVNEREKILELITENKGLRELLEISKSSGSLFYPLTPYDTVDKEVQSEEKAAEST